MKEYSEILKYKGKLFRYNYNDSLVEYGFISQEDDADFGWKTGEFIEIDAIGLSRENWENKEARNEYLQEYIFQLEEELRYLV